MGQYVLNEKDGRTLPIYEKLFHGDSESENMQAGGYKRCLW